MAQFLVTFTLLAAVLTIKTNAQFEFLPDFSRNNLLQFLRNLQDTSGSRVLKGNEDPAEVQVIVHSPTGVEQEIFRRQDNRFQPQPHFQPEPVRFQPQPQFQPPQPQFQPLQSQFLPPESQFQQPPHQFQSQPRPQFQPPPQPQFQPPPQPQFQPPPQPQFQPPPQPQFQPPPQPQFQPQPQPPPPTTPPPRIEATTLLNISENFVLPEAEFRQRPQKEPQFLAPGSGRWLLQQDPACLPCICETASGCDETLQCDSRGFCGPFLLSKRYWTLSGKPILRGDNPDRPAAATDCLRDPICAAEAVRGYLDKFAQDCDGNRRVDCLDLARIHFQGPFNCRARPFEYMDTFRRCWDPAVRSRNLTP